jgi:hypothetical protein
VLAQRLLFVVTGGASKVRQERPGPEAMADARTESWAAECHFLLVTIDGPRMTLEPIAGLGSDGKPRYVGATTRFSVPPCLRGVVFRHHGGMRSGARRLLLCALATALAACENAPATQPEPPPSTTTTTTTLRPASQGCGLPASRRDTCAYIDSTFRPAIDRAIMRVQREQPQLFDFTQANDELSVFVRDVNRYHEAVVQALRDAGLCAIFDGEEVAVKNSNEFSDQYDIITASDFVRWGDGAYAATCRPAGF